MNLKQAKSKGKLAQFIREREKEKLPPGDQRKLTAMIKKMALRTAKSKRGTSSSASSGG